MLIASNTLASALIAAAGSLGCPEASAPQGTAQHAAAHQPTAHAHAQAQAVHERHSAAHAHGTAALAALADGGALTFAKHDGTKHEKDDGKHSINIVNDEGAFGLTMKDGEIVEATVDGEKIPKDRIQREGDRVRLLDEDGDELIEFRVLADGGFWIGDGDPPAHGLAGGLFAEGLGHGDAMEFKTIDGQEPRPMIGVTLSEVDEAVADQLGLDAEEVVLISGVTEGLPADKAGIKRSDIVVKIDGGTPATEERLRELIASKKQGEKIRLEVIRKGKPQEVTIEIAQVKPRVVAGTAVGGAQGGQFKWRGMDEDSLRALQAQSELLAQQGARMGRDAGRAAADEARRLAEVVRAQAHDTKKMVAELRERLAKEYEELDLRLTDDDRKKLREAFDKAADALEHMDFSVEGPRMRVRRLGGEGADVFIAPTPPPTPVAPTAPVPPGAPRSWSGQGGSNDRLDRLEERMDKIQELLEKIAEKKDR